MGRLLNEDFADWNQGTSFTNPAADTELADDWFATGGTQSIIQGSGAVSSFCLTSTNIPGSVGNGFYQDLSVSNIDLVKVTYTVFNSSTPRETFSITLNDGVDDYSSGDLQPSYTAGTPASAEVFIPFNPAATTMRVTVLKTGPSGNSVQFHALILQAVFRLGLSDGIALSEALVPPTGPVQTGKALHDSIRIQDWLRKRKRPPQNRWKN